jgi:hypothetical protein
LSIFITGYTKYFKEAQAPLCKFLISTTQFFLVFYKVPTFGGRLGKVVKKDTQTWRKEEKLAILLFSLSFTSEELEPGFKIP